MKLRKKSLIAISCLAAMAVPVLSSEFVTPARAVTGVTGNPRLYFGVNMGISAGIYWKNLDGTGGATRLTTTGATATDVGGLTIDPHNGYVYWTNCGAQLTLSRARLDGTGGTDLRNTSPTGCPWGIDIDHVGHKVYYADYYGGAIYRTEMDGSNQTLVNPTGTSAVTSPTDIVIDPVSGFLYWTNETPPGISRIQLSNYVGSDVSTSPVSSGTINSMLIDRGAGKVYWSDWGHRSPGSAALGVTNLDGSGSAQDITPGAPWPYGNPQGIAADIPNNKIYFASGDAITSMSTTGTNPVDFLQLPGQWVSMMAILAPPSNIVAPTVTGSNVVGSTLTCSSGDWEMNRQEQKFFNAPTSYAYSWTLNGNLTSDTNATVTAGTGSYACLVTASNEAGTNTVASSNTLTVAASTTTSSTTTSSTTTTTVATTTTSSTTTTLAPTTTVVRLTESVVLGLPVAAPPLVDDDSLSSGMEVTVTADGFASREFVQLIVASTPQVIGSGYANTQGVVTLKGTIPADLASGRHTLAVFAPGTGTGFKQTITVSSLMLPPTGSNNNTILIMALVVIAVGSVLMVRRRGLVT